MNPPGGNFGQAIGTDSRALQEAMARRGLGGAATAVVSPGSPTAPNNPLPQPVGAGTPSAMPPRQAMPNPGEPGGAPSSESTLILKAMDSRMKSISKMQEMGIQV